MKHLTNISISKGQAGDDEVNGMLERIFGFVLNLVEQKGKSADA